MVAHTYNPSIQENDCELKTSLGFVEREKFGPQVQ